MNRYEDAMSAVTSLPCQGNSLDATHGDTIGDKVMFLGVRETSFGEKLSIDIRCDNGRVLSRIVNGMLESKLMEHAIEVSDVIALKYWWQKASANGRNYNAYVVRKLEDGPYSTDSTRAREQGAGVDRENSFDDDIPF